MYEFHAYPTDMVKWKLIPIRSKEKKAKKDVRFSFYH